jgi:hypothetical protein
MTDEFIAEEPRRTPIAGGYDVIVAGGGIAGVAAAVAAARNGASVCLLEKTCSLGGLATLGNVIVWLPLCDGRGRQVIAGMGEELLKLSVANLDRDHPQARMRNIPACWQDGGDAEQRRHVRYLAEFNPAQYLLDLESLVADEEITLLYDTLVCSAVRSEDRITHVVTESKAGRRALAAGAVIDATGDADICHLAGERTESLDTNALSAWYYQWRGQGLVLRRLMKSFSPVGDARDAEGPLFSAESPEQVTAYMLGSRQLIRDDLARARRENPEDFVEPVMLQTIPSFRMTRRLVGQVSLSEADVHRWFEDTIGLTGDWRKAGGVYAIPYRALTGVANRNLLAAGRCISADRSVWDVTRVIPPCAVTGAAAGTAAAMACSETRGDVSALSIQELQERLREQGELIEPALVEPGDA